ncbi:glycoside hydrolase family 43 protein [Flammeovirga pacifica]|uniref:Arabinan endo-1,5-alpha-L-arabinosidase n=1 Tax=Flammeovirga pacifica TaxID=915059 RepID=A0A1S1YTD0_FLAPC|nr:glycoside hydrolase family 43 protein [Flammeovirga pacifica]OHX64268.1 arabinan endo-1,5-alpha-L-arabinosidase [Flammeovirga pacifica]
MKFTLNLSVLFLFFLSSCQVSNSKQEVSDSKNPVFPGWYADPEGVVFGNEYWIYPTYSAKYTNQVYFDAFSSKDLVHWTKHEHVLDTSNVQWAKQALWAPSIIQKEDKYFFFFSANDVQKKGGPNWNEENTINHYGGIGISVADSPAGPFKDYIGQPLINEFHNDAQPIDQFVYEDNGTYYMFYGGWKRCNLVILNKDFKSLQPWEDGSLYKEVTPEGYVEGPFMFKRNGKYYFMWSEGFWGQDSYKVAYSISDKVTGPFKRIGTILSSNKNIATGAGHHSIINVPNTDDWYIIYHRRPIPNEGRDHRVTCIDRMYFNEDGTIKNIKMTFDGVLPQLIDSSGMESK